MTSTEGAGQGDDNWLARRRAKRAAKKSRLAAMTRPRRVLRFGLIVATWFLGVVAVLMVLAVIGFYTVTDVPRPESLPLPQVATVEYSDGSTLATIGSVDRTIVNLNQVPSTVRYAVLAAEDRDFYTNSAVSIRGTARAAASDLTGGDTQGGSGITQQYVKNAYLNDAQSLTRKLKELAIAVKLSRQYSKNDILEFYLNTVYFGRNTYGIQAASRAYFGTDVSKLSTAQGAVLASLLRAPAYYDPAADPGAARARWRYVLDGMVQTGHLTGAQEASMTYPKVKPPKGTGLGSSGWKFLLVNRVLADLQSHGISTKEVYARGMKIRTTISRHAQTAAVSAIDTTFQDLTKKQRNLKNALVAVKPRDGGVLAYYGGSGPGVKDYAGKIDYNDYASGGRRPPGSSFKPYTLATVLTQTLDKTKDKSPLAIDSEVNGSFCTHIDGTKICNDPGDASVSASEVTIAHAMKYSLNTTFDLLAFDAGPAAVAATAHAMGVEPTDSTGHKTLVGANGATNFGIGIGDYPVTTLDQAAGYATLQNKGMANQPYFVEQATASDGSTVYMHKAAPKRAIDPKVANDVTLTLEPVAKYSGDALDGRDSAAKTGTEGVGPKSPNNSDAWMVGYTPQVSASVWVGSGSNDPIYNKSGNPLYGANLPGQTWKLFMDDYLHGKPDKTMATRQLISADGSTLEPTPSQTYTAPSSDDSNQNDQGGNGTGHRHSPSNTFSISTGFSSSSTPPPTHTTPPSTPTTTPKPTSTCTATLLHQCRP